MPANTSVLDALIEELPDRLSDWWENTVTKGVVADLKAQFNTSPPGRIYIRNGVPHVASRPGYPPNVDTDALRQSVHYVMDGLLRSLVMDGVPHGVVMEFGTTDGRVEHRPWWIPVIDRWRDGKLIAAAQALRLL